MTTASLAFAPGTLLRSLRSATGRALATGALRSIETDRHFIEQGGVRFLVRSVSSLARRDRARIGEAGKSGDGARRRNPFLPYDPDLFVADISPTHLCLLNKFNVMDHHMLIVTREFEDQRAPLTAADFAALWACLTEIDGLGFYNGGTAAGASQPHKHLQIVPLPLASEGPAIPLEPLLDAATAGHAIQDLPSLPFANAFVRLEPSLLHDASAATVLEQRYRTMLDRVGADTRRRRRSRMAASLQPARHPPMDAAGPAIPRTFRDDLHQRPRFRRLPICPGQRTGGNHQTPRPDDRPRRRRRPSGSLVRRRALTGS